MATRNVSLTAQLDAFVEARVRSGDYQNASEVIRTGLRLLKEREEEYAAKLAALVAAAEEGEAAIARGDYIELDVDEIGPWLDTLGRGGVHE